MRWDIFCKIVDNFGDIGVCWRLAQQLKVEHGIQVQLWVDDLSVTKKLIPTLDASLQTQTISGVTINAWHKDTKFSQVADVVIETFSCELPPSYLAHLTTNTPWINLEYLSAEPWVEDFHAKHAKYGHLSRHFFFPGFTPTTGGLLREHNVVKNNQQLTSNKQLKQCFFQTLNLPMHEGIKVSLFCYPHAPIQALLKAMANANQIIHCYVPATAILPQIASYFSKKTIQTGDVLRDKNLNCHILPFLSQEDYDKLLATCDINFVRGEDSWIRAIWAGKPFIWQPYFQSEDTHLTKLNAFLTLFFAGCEDETQQVAHKLHTAWQTNDVPIAVWENYLNKRTALTSFTQKQTNKLANQTDLATKLVIFSKKISENISKNQV